MAVDRRVGSTTWSPIDRTKCSDYEALVRSDRGGPVSAVRGATVDALAGLDGGDAEGGCEMTLPVPGGPRKWTTSIRPMKSSWASAMMRPRSSEGWKVKSKLSSVLGGGALRCWGSTRRWFLPSSTEWAAVGAHLSSVKCSSTTRRVVAWTRGLANWVRQSSNWALRSSSWRGMACRRGARRRRG